MKNITPTYEWVESRRLDGVIIRESRERLVAQHKFNKVKTYNPHLHKFAEEDCFDHSHFDTLIEHEYCRLRGLYAIPFTHDEFSDHIYEHRSIYRWRYYRQERIRNARIDKGFSGWGRNWIRPWDISTSGESRFIQHGIEKKTEPVSDQYQVNHDQARKEWRQKKGFSRDQGKGKHYCNCCLNDARAGRRAWERDMIRKGKWDEMDDNKDLFTNGWECC